MRLFAVECLFQHLRREILGIGIEKRLEAVHRFRAYVEEVEHRNAFLVRSLDVENGQGETSDLGFRQFSVFIKGIRLGEDEFPRRLEYEVFKPFFAFPVGSTKAPNVRRKSCIANLWIPVVSLTPCSKFFESE